MSRYAVRVHVSREDCQPRPDAPGCANLFHPCLDLVAAVDGTSLPKRQRTDGEWSDRTGSSDIAHLRTVGRAVK